MGSHVESKWIDVNGFTIHYLEGGVGDPLVMLHGGASGAEDEWTLNLEPLARHYRIVAPDMIGYGKSDKPNIVYTTTLFNRFFVDFISALGLESASLMGHSLGGGIALAFTLNYPQKVNKLILVDSAGLANSVALLGKMLIPIFMLKAKLRKDKTYLSLVRNGGREPSESYMDRLSEIATPTFILWGSWDGYLPVRLAYQAHEQLRYSRLHVFKRCWHAPQMERATEFNSLVLNFLEH